MAGFFITFEGIDGSGKSVQIERLLKYVRGEALAVAYFRDPGATQISERIRDILLDKNNIAMSPWTELLLYESARAQMVEELILPALRQNKLVLCDRFYDSTTAYQGYGRQLFLETVALANQIGSCGVTPDLTFLIDVDLEVDYEFRFAILEALDPPAGNDITYRPPSSFWIHEDGTFRIHGVPPGPYRLFVRVDKSSTDLHQRQEMIGVLERTITIPEASGETDADEAFDLGTLTIHPSKSLEWGSFLFQLLQPDELDR